MTRRSGTRRGRLGILPAAVCSATAHSISAEMHAREPRADGADEHGGVKPRQERALVREVRLGLDAHRDRARDRTVGAAPRIVLAGQETLHPSTRAPRGGEEDPDGTGEESSLGVVRRERRGFRIAPPLSRGAPLVPDEIERARVARRRRREERVRELVAVEGRRGGFRGARSRVR